MPGEWISLYVLRIPLFRARGASHRGFLLPFCGLMLLYECSSLWSRPTKRGSYDERYPFADLFIFLADQTCVISSAAWTLVIALTTYITLCHPFSPAAAKIEHRFAFPCIAVVVLLLGVVPSIATTVIYDMVDAGGICWLPSGTIQANLMLFVPRATTLVLVIGLYLRLFLFFRTRDMEAFDTTTEYDNDEDAARRGSKRLSMASLRLSNWRRSSDVSRRTSNGPTGALPPSGFLSPKSPSSAPLSPIPGSPTTQFSPGSPAIVFNTSFGPNSSQDRNPPSQSVSISFPEPGSPTASHDDSSRRGSAPDSVSHKHSSSLPPNSSAPFEPIASDFHTPPPPKRPNSAAFPARFSVGTIGGGGGGAAGDGTPPSEKRKRRPLSPRQVNRRLAVLMMVYPAAYCLLVAVAIARLIQSFSRGNAAAAPALRYTSAFLIFLQGAIDGMLFVFVSFVFKRWTRRGE